MPLRYSSSSFEDVFTPLETDFTLIDPRENSRQFENTDDKPQNHRRPRCGTIWSKAKAISMSLSLWIFTVTFVVLYSIYIYQALLSPNPQVGNLLLSASNTNVLVSVLSQVFAELIRLLFVGAFDSLRWQLASGRSGVSMATFFELSTATEWLSVLLLAISGPIHSFWWLIRLALPLAGLFLGSVLKFQATFVYYFRQTRAEIPVFAGWMPLDQRVLDIIHPSRICMYFVTWTPTLLGVPKYAISMATPGCAGSCTSVFLPGGLETARMVSPILNSTLLEGGVFENAETIRIDNAPGLLLKFDQPQADFDFDRERECSVYGQKTNDSIQICIKSVNQSLAVGWAACPTSQFDTGTCVTNITWTQKRIKKKTLMTAYKQYATTAYKREDFSILDVHRTSEPYIQPLDKSDFIATWSKIFIPTNNSSPQDITMIDALMFSLTWLLRLYDDVFPDDTNTPLTHLQNFLAIPLQFMVTCTQFANYSMPAGTSGIFVLPEDMQTTAASGESAQRFAGQVWTVWAFISSASLFMAVVGGMFLWMLLQQEPLPNSSGIPEIDIVTRIGEEGENHGLVTLRELARDENLNDHSRWRLARSLRRRRVKIIRENGSPAGGISLLVDRKGSHRAPQEPSGADEVNSSLRGSGNGNNQDFGNG